MNKVGRVVVVIFLSWALSFNCLGYNAYKDDRNCETKVDHVIKLTLTTNYHAKSKTPLVHCLLYTWQLIFSFLCRSGQPQLTPLCLTETHQSSVSVPFKQLVALIDYGMEFWHRILQVARKVMLGVLARITFGLMLHSKWLTKCCVAILCQGWCRAGTEWPRVEWNYSGVEGSWQQKWGNNLSLSSCTVPQSAIMYVIVYFRRTELLSGVQERSGI